MRLEFSNKKERKNCQYFIKALKEVEKYHLKEPERPLYLTLTPHDLRLVPVLTDLHHQRVEATCLIVLKNDVFARECEEGEDGRVYRLNSYKMLRAFKKNENKISLIELRFTPDSLMMSFQTENKQMITDIKIDCQQVEGQWPENPESTAENNYELITVGTLSAQELAAVNLGDSKDNLWMEVGPPGITFRTVEKGRYRRESKMDMSSQTGFNFNNLKAKLRNRVFFNLKGDNLLDHFYQMLKKKRNGLLMIKMINDPYLAQQVKYTYILSKTNTDFGYHEKVIECFLCEQMGEVGEQSLRLERDQKHENEARENLLMKREEGNVEEMRRIVINHLSEVDEDKRMAEGAFRERRPVGKIEEGEQTLSRRFQSKY